MPINQLTIVPEIRFDIYRYLVLVTPKLSIKSFRDEDKEEAPRSMAILATNSQIHTEAATVLYGELTISVHSSDILALAHNKAGLLGL